MSELRLRFATDATVRAKKTSDSQVFSVFDVMNLVYPTMSNSWKNKKWKTLTEKSEYKDELEFTEEYLKYQDEDVTSNNTKKRRLRKTPVMTRGGDLARGGEGGDLRGFDALGYKVRKCVSILVRDACGSGSGFRGCCDCFTFSGSQ